ncbi:MAG: T9SS type A sorting domain-containing protein [Ignavibacteriaceae bacterium]|nr:T9SS type A sorting domain-containing protein [Ignavibacteriaceae bacterium]
MDEQYSVLNTDEMITLEYSAPPMSEGMERTFIFVSRGRYEKQEGIAEGKTRLQKDDNTTSSEQNSIVYEYELSQNSPNPFNPTTTITYQIKEKGFTTLKIYDLLGKEVATLVNEEKQAGKYSIEFNASKLSSGVYLYELRSKEFKSTKKLLLMK